MIQVFIVPGNPGLSGYYEEFKYDLSKILQFDKYNINILNYENFSKNNNKTYSIYQELDNIKNQILEKTNQKDSIILIGHSIGGWVCLNLIDDLEKLNINVINCILLFPYLKTNKKIIKQNLFRKIINLNVNNFFIYKKIIINFISKNMTAYSKDITKKYFIKNDKYIEISNKFAKTYIDNLDYNKDYIKKYRNKIFMIYAPNDMWCTKYDYNSLKEYIDIDIIKDVSHSFCVKDVEIKKVIQSIKIQLLKNKIIQK